jgi:hypothetical protein
MTCRNYALSLRGRPDRLLSCRDAAMRSRRYHFATKSIVGQLTSSANRRGREGKDDFFLDAIQRARCSRAEHFDAMRLPHFYRADSVDSIAFVRGIGEAM